MIAEASSARNGYPAAVPMPDRIQVGPRQPDEPADPIAAATHPDPYPYYARLVAGRPLPRNERLGLRVASSAEAVAGVLTHPLARVRPASEPVPRALVSSGAGDIFGRLVRMNDGARHGRTRPAVQNALEAFDSGRIERDADRLALALRGPSDALEGGPGLDTFAFALPLSVIGSLLGFPDGELADLARDAGRLTCAMSSSAAESEVADGRTSATRLLERFDLSLDRRPAPATLLGSFEENGRRRGLDREEIVANSVGFLTQARDATAGLLSASLLALARHPDLLPLVKSRPEALSALVEEVLRFDSPVQNTRRFFPESATVVGETVDAGDAVLVLLAAANRDPKANPDPDRFDLARVSSRTFTFGLGAHACPGKTFATTIALCGVRALLAGGLDPARLGPSPDYEPSPNCRIPRLRPRARQPAEDPV
jgi:cytochrome P450